MREILFRGKRTDNGEWVYGAFVPDATEPTHGDMITWGFIRNYNKKIGKMQTIEVDRETVGQFTGLCDKNGKKIFEGDVVRHGYTITYSDGKTSDFYSNMKISFSNHYGGWIVGEQGILTFKTIQKYSIEIIGNIHDNPDPLEQTP